MQDDENDWENREWKRQEKEEDDDEDEDWRSAEAANQFI